MPASTADPGNLGAHGGGGGGGGGSVLRPPSASGLLECWHARSNAPAGAAAAAAAAARKRVLFAPASERVWLTGTELASASASASVIVSSVLLAKNYDKDL